MAALIADWRTKSLPKYANSTQYDYGLMLGRIELATLDFDVAEVDASHILAIRRQWTDKPRTANKYRSLLSILMAHAIEEGLRTTNPVHETEPLEEPVRKRYIEHDELLSIIDGVMKGDDGRANPSGPMIKAIIEFSYLTAMRMGDIRNLTWAQVDAERKVIRLTPRKTKRSTGATIEIVVTDEIQAIFNALRQYKNRERRPRRKTDPVPAKIDSIYVFHNLKGRPYTKDGIETAWERGCRRAKVEDANFHDVRAKSLSDAESAGVTLKALQAAAAHSSAAMTEKYLRLRRTKTVNLGMAMPVKRAGKRTGS